MVELRIPFVMPKTRIALTQLGKQKLEELNIVGAKGEIMWYLKEHGISNLKEIAEYKNMAPIRVKGIVKELASKDYQWVEWV